MDAQGARVCYCPAGTQRDGAGVCQACPAGTFRAVGGAASKNEVCSPCPTGSASASSGAASCATATSGTIAMGMCYVNTATGAWANCFARVISSVWVQP